MLRTLAFASLLACPLAALAVEPGEWELSIQTLMTGTQKPAAASQKRCFTEADARDPSRVLSGGAMCEFTNKSERGGTFTFDVSCGGPLPMQGSGSVVHTAQTIEGSLDLKAKDAAFQMQTILKGRRLGPC